MKRRSNKAFTILELLVVVAIIAILAIISLPNFIGRIEDAKASQELAEINAVTKAINTYYADKGNYPTLQSKDGTLLQPQPIEGAPHNIDFSSLVPDYLATLPHFSYWWVDYQGEVYHTEKPVGSLSGTTFTPTAGYTYTLYKTNGATQVLSAPYTLLAGDYITGADDTGSEIPKISLAFKNAKMHPEDPEYVAVPTLPVNTTYTFTNAGATGRTGPTQSQLTTAYASTTLAGNVTSSNGIQLWTVPATGSYRITALGARGGKGANVNGKLGGLGANMVGVFNLTQGTVLNIVVGQQGLQGLGNDNCNGSGGGGSFVYTGSIGGSGLLMAAGGGGGGSSANYATSSLANANVTEGGNSGYGTFEGLGGTLGNGGSGGVGSGDYRGGGGAGWKSSGGAGCYSNGGNRWLGGFNTAHQSVGGGFGGGGDVGDYRTNYHHGAGGGGGYSGGGGSYYTGGGGGGGSYNAGTDKSSSVSNTGQGSVTITYVGP